MQKVQELPNANELLKVLIRHLRRHRVQDGDAADVPIADNALNLITCPHISAAEASIGGVLTELHQVHGHRCKRLRFTAEDEPSNAQAAGSGDASSSAQAVAGNQVGASIAPAAQAAMSTEASGHFHAAAAALQHAAPAQHKSSAAGQQQRFLCRGTLELSSESQCGQMRLQADGCVIDLPSKPETSFRWDCRSESGRITQHDAMSSMQDVQAWAWSTLLEQSTANEERAR